jgi:sulfate adenylyltransferase
MIGTRETLWQALICRNYGANHMIVSCNHTGNGNNQPHLEQDLVDQCRKELGVTLVPNKNKLAIIPRGLEQVAPASNARLQRVARRRKNGHKASARRGQKNLTEFLAETSPPRHKQGVCIWFTGLSGSGKSTTAEVLTWLLLTYDRQVTVLDGDVVRTHLSKGLGFSREDRDTNVRRIGFVASELVRIGGAVICAVVSPYRAVRNDVRQFIGEDQFVEVFVDTPLVICEARDVKGMYARARRGGVTGFTGIDDPYEPPVNPEIILDTVNNTPQENSQRIIDYLIEKGYIRVRKFNTLRNMRTSYHVS